MKLKSKRIKFEDIKTKSKKGAFESNISNVLGCFEHFSGLTFISDDSYSPTINLGPEEEIPQESITDLFDRLKEKSGHLEGDERVKFLLNMTVMVHERRHFYDCFCTPIGHELFVRNKFSVIYKSLLLSVVVNNIDPLLKPLHYECVQEIIDRFASEPLKEIVGSVFRQEHLLGMQFGFEPLIVLEGELYRDVDYLEVELETPDGEVNVVPCMTTLVVGDGVMYTSVWPIGFCLMTECLAILTQGQYLYDVEPKLRDIFRENLKEGLGVVNPYIPLLGMLVRVFKKHSAMPSDNDIFRCVYRSLFFTPDDVFTVKEPSHHIGWSLIYILKNWVEVVNEEVQWVGPNLHEMPCVEAPLYGQDSIPEAFLHYIVKNCRNSLIESQESIRLEKEGICVDHLFGATFIDKGEPEPPFALISNEQIAINDMEFYKHWLLNELWTTAVEEFWSQPGINVCPLRNPNSTWKFPDERGFPSDHCVEGRANHTCGVWDRKSEYDGPDCPWVEVLKGLLTIPEGKKAASGLSSHWES